MAKRKAAAPARRPVRSKQKTARSARAASRSGGSHTPIRGADARRASATKKAKPAKKKKKILLSMEGN